MSPYKWYTQNSTFLLDFLGERWAWEFEYLFERDVFGIFTYVKWSLSVPWKIETPWDPVSQQESFPVDAPLNSTTQNPRGFNQLELGNGKRGERWKIRKKGRRKTRLISRLVQDHIANGVLDWNTNPGGFITKPIPFLLCHTDETNLNEDILSIWIVSS